MCLPDYLIFYTSGLIIVVCPFVLVRHYCFLVLREMVLRARVFTLCLWNLWWRWLNHIYIMH